MKFQKKKKFLDKSLLIMFIFFIVLILALTTMAIFSFNRNKDYQKITLQEIESQKNKLDGKKVEYTGIFESMFETSNLDGKIWLETSSKTMYVPNSKEFPGISSGYYHAKVRVYGTLMTKKTGYGHLGMAPFQISADKIELLEKMPFPNITETKTFSEIEGFTFDYPVFKGWEIKEIKKVNENEYVILINNPLDAKTSNVSRIRIKKIDELPKTATISPVKINTNEVVYSELGQDSYIFSSSYNFSKGDFIVVVTLEEIPDDSSFSKIIFWKTIINSIKFEKSAQIIEIKTFSEIPGFIFEYPVFKDWETNVVKEKDNYYGIYLSHDKIDFGIAPKIGIVKKIKLVQIDLTKLSTNPYKVKYIYNKEEGKIFFHAPGFTIDIYPFMYESNGYSGKVSVGKIIETFRFN